MMKRAIIISNGSISDYSFYKNFFKTNDYIICADGGIKHCLNLGIVPDLWIGDFDSCNLGEICEDNPELKSVEILGLNPCKDETDTHKACIIAIEKGYKEIALIGSIGTRLDHSLSNIHLLEFMHEKGISASLVNENNTVRIFDKYIKLAKNRKYLSLVPLDASVTVTDTFGLKYPLHNFLLKRSVSMGVSNEVCGESAEIHIKNGMMLIIESND